MEACLIAGLKALPKNWRRKAEKIMYSPEEIGESVGVGVHDFTCPISEIPTVLVIIEDNEVFKITDRGTINWIVREV